MPEIRELLQDVGIEFEFSNVPEETMKSLEKLKELGFSATYDASAQTWKKANFYGIEYKGFGSRAPQDVKRIKCGGEAVSQVLFNGVPEKMLSHLGEFTCFLHSLGEPHKHTRSGIHYHFCYTYNVSILKTLMVLAKHLEKVFFTIGGMGYENRGIYNDAIYFRPITRTGPLIVPTNGSWAQAFTVEELLKAENSVDFFIRYGDLIRMLNKIGRYFPVRYHWINLANLPTDKGTLEFRVFNITLDPLNIWASLQFCSAFAKFALMNDLNSLRKLGLTQENSIYDQQGKKHIFKTAKYFCKVAEIPTKVTDLILGLVDTSPEPVLQEKLVLSHLQARGKVINHWPGGEYIPPLLPVTAVPQNPHFEDIHNIPDESRSHLHLDSEMEEDSEIDSPPDSINSIFQRYVESRGINIEDNEGDE